MMKQLMKLALCLAALPLAACSSLGGEGYGLGDYLLVRVHRVNVGDGGMSVVAPRPWNERRRSILFDDVREVEDWTLNGPILDGISFVSGMKSGRYLIRQRKTADQQVPKFRSDMTPPEIAAMLESLYRVRGGAVALLQCDAARLRSDRRVRANPPLAGRRHCEEPKATRQSKKLFARSHETTRGRAPDPRPCLSSCLRGFVRKN
jgi:hypothetical protein